eukprot:TRINITY_DN15609_c0_g1_i1.p1 TRINITY_DN15609_c0_g1~~TRINITY_DN15609_c0_g1_i1.p1  ORF type:complete len:232 (-),score=42.95 TRINITY_DN15609_c0_g1_i1:38-733(-)
MAGDLETWWRELPPVTKFLFAGSFSLTLAANFGLVNPMLLLLDMNSIYKRFEIWRLVTAFLFQGSLGFAFLMNLMFLVQYGGSVENQTFGGVTADYLTFILFCSALLLVPGFFVPLPILGTGLILSIIYYWARKNPNVPMTFMFGLRFQSMYFPWVLIGFRILLGGFPLSEICGALVGHLYFFLVDVYPATNGGRRILFTPQFLKDLFPPTRVAAAAAGGAGINWGRGHRL